MFTWSEEDVSINSTSYKRSDTASNVVVPSSVISVESLVSINSTSYKRSDLSFSMPERRLKVVSINSTSYKRSDLKLATVKVLVSFLVSINSTSYKRSDLLELSG